MEKKKAKRKISKKQEERKEEIAETGFSSKFSEKKTCTDKNCHLHGNLKTRGRIFEGKVIKKLHKRVTLEFERMIYVRKYERFAKSKTKIHARLPLCMDDQIKVGDLIKVQECRPLSKLIHFVVIKKIKDTDKEVKK